MSRVESGEPGPHRVESCELDVNRVESAGRAQHEPRRDGVIDASQAELVG
jgi:hypothetical protein